MKKQSIKFTEIENLLLNFAPGLQLKDLTEHEVKILEKEYGPNWKIEFGFETQTKNKRK